MIPKNVIILPYSYFCGHTKRNFAKQINLALADENMGEIMNKCKRFNIGGLYRKIKKYPSETDENISRIFWQPCAACHVTQRRRLVK